MEKGGLVSKTKIEVEPSIITSVVTGEAVERLDIKPGDRVYSVIKSIEVVIAKTVSAKNGGKSLSEQPDPRNTDPSD